MAQAITARERVMAALGRERIFPIPVGAVTQPASLDQMNASSAYWPEAHRDPELMARLAEAARTILGFEVVRVPFDQTIESELLGSEIIYGDSVTNCSVRTHPYSMDDPLPPLPDLGSGRARIVMEALGLLKRWLDSDAAILGGIVGPFTLAGQMLGVTEMLMGAMRRPQALAPYIDFAVSLGIEYANRLVAAGADAICIEDMSASLDLTSPAIYRDLILPAQQRLIAAVQAPTILHVCGANTRILDSLFAAGASALSLETRTDLNAACAAKSVAIIGGIPPVEVLLAGSVADVGSACEASLRAGVHILAPGCGIPVNTPLENLKEMVRVSRGWRS